MTDKYGKTLREHRRAYGGPDETYVTYPDRAKQRLCARTLLTGRPKPLREFARLYRIALGHGEAGGWLFHRHNGDVIAQGYAAYFEKRRGGCRLFATTDGERAFLNDAGVRMFDQMLRARLAPGNDLVHIR